MNEQGQPPTNPRREPVFLLPGDVTAVLGVLAAIHLASTLVLNQPGQLQLVFWFAFQPLISRWQFR